MILGQFDLHEMQSELNLRLMRSDGKQQDKKMSAEEFIATTDLTNPQLYEHHNQCKGFLPKPLLAAALKHLIQLTTVRCL